MKTFALLAALAATLAANAANTLAWWTFDDDPLGVTDATGNFNTLTNGGIAIVDGAASFDGTAKVFSTIRPLPVESTKAYTFECFVRPATTQNSSAGILELSPNAGSYDGGAFIFYPDGAMEHRTINNKPKWTGRKLQKNILDDQWHHLAAIFTPGGTCHSRPKDRTTKFAKRGFGANASTSARAAIRATGSSANLTTSRSRAARLSRPSS